MMEMANDSSKLFLGYMFTALAGDSRYVDRIEVYQDYGTRKVHVVVSERTAVNGMDGYQGPTSYEVRAQAEVDPNPGLVLKTIKKFIADDRFNFKKYGKASKNFTIRTRSGERSGINLSLIEEALLKEGEGR